MAAMQVNLWQPWETSEPELSKLNMCSWMKSPWLTVVACTPSVLRCAWLCRLIIRHLEARTWFFLETLHSYLLLVLTHLCTVTLYQQSCTIPILLQCRMDTGQGTLAPSDCGCD